MDKASTQELELLRQKLIDQLIHTRKVMSLVTPYNSDLRLLCLRQIGRNLLCLDLLDVRIAEKSGELITPYWIPRK